METSLQWLTVGVVLLFGVVYSQRQIPVERFFGKLRNGDSICAAHEVCGTIYRFTKTRREVTYHERHITSCTCANPATPCTVNATDNSQMNGLNNSRTIQEVVCQPLDDMNVCEPGEIARAQIEVPFEMKHFEIYCKCPGHFIRHFGISTATVPVYPTTEEINSYPYRNLRYAIQVYACTSFDNIVR